MKKFLISTLVAVMCLGFGATALAASTEVGAAFTDIAGHEAEFALTALGGLGIYTGDSGLGGAVKPDDPITRAQFCKVVVLAAGRGSTAAGLAGLQPTFTDGASIPSWAWGYVNVALYMGIINGYPDGSFGPNNPVTYAEAVTMLIKLVSGHAAQVGPGIWPYNYLFYGVDNGFTGGVDVGFANLPATRGDVARMLFATMQINKLDKDGNELKEVEGDPDSVDTAYLAYRVDEGILDSVDLAGNRCVIGGHGPYSLAAKVYVAGASDLASLLMVNVIAVENAAGDIVAIGKNEAAETVAGVFKEFDPADAEDPADYIVLKDGTKVPYEAPAWTLNGDAQVDLIDDGLTNDLLAGDELVITVNEDGLAAFVVATRFEDFDYIVEDGVTESTEDEDGNPINTKVEGATLGEFEVLPNAVVTVNGAAADRDTLAEYDVFAVALNDDGDAVAVRATRQVAEGTVAGTSISFPGPVFRVTIDLKAGGTKTYVINDDGYVDLPNKGDLVKYGLDADGKLFVPIGYEGLTPFVLVKSFVVNGDGTASATVDVRGTEVTYKVANSYIDVDGDDTLDPDEPWLYDLFADYAENGWLVWIEVDGATNTIVDVAEPTLLAGWYVLANAGGALTLGDDPEEPESYKFIPANAGITVYQWDADNEVYFYIAVDKLTVTDDMVLVETDGGTSYGFDGELDTVPDGVLWTWEPLV